MISPKMNVVSRLAFELAYDDITICHINHDATQFAFRRVIWIWFTKDYLYETT